MRKVVLDTNVIISALGWRGNARKVLEKCLGGGLILLESPEMLKETKAVLDRSKFNFIPPDKKREIHKQLAAIAEMQHPRIKPRVVKQDPADDKFLWCALAGGAKIIVSGDEHLLALKKYRGIKILTPKEFLDLFPED